MKRISPSILLFLLTILFLSGCDDTVTNDQIDSITIPASNVSFNKYILPLFDVKCNNTNCHSSMRMAGGLGLDSYAAVTSSSSVVFPSIPDNSKLVWAIEGRTVTPMPPVGYPALTKNQITGIRTWIKEGAKNN